MLSVFYGNDTIAVRKAAFECVPDVSKVVIDADTYTNGAVVDAAGSSSLFGDALTYVFDTPSSNKEFEEELMGVLPELTQSPHRFIVIENKLLVAQKKLYEKHADSMEERATAAENGFNVFSIADALSRKDKKTLWVLLHDATRAGFSSEEIIGTIWWQLKTLRLAANTGSAGEAGMKDFPYTKTKRSLTHFKENELATISQSLLAAYHDARRGKLELDLALERWVLGL